VEVVREPYEQPAAFVQHHHHNSLLLLTEISVRPCS
jgi:hypothetical protein